VNKTAPVEYAQGRFSFVVSIGENWRPRHILRLNIISTVPSLQKATEISLHSLLGLSIMARVVNLSLFSKEKDDMDANL
jgi:hypothetical protein